MQNDKSTGKVMSILRKIVKALNPSSRPVNPPSTEFAYLNISGCADQDYEWYVKKVPLVRGEVVCRVCGSKKILVDFGATPWRRTHFCGTCGEKLYFSKR